MHLLSPESSPSGNLSKTLPIRGARLWVSGGSWDKAVSKWLILRKLSWSSCSIALVERVGTLPDIRGMMVASWEVFVSHTPACHSEIAGGSFLTFSHTFLPMICESSFPHVTASKPWHTEWILSWMLTDTILVQNIVSPDLASCEGINDLIIGGTWGVHHLWHAEESHTFPTPVVVIQVPMDGHAWEDWLAAP
jgi:hypothetical protein